MIRVGSSEDHGLALDVIQIDGGTQSRATLNQHVVDDYAEAIKAGATFPPIVVFYDGKKHWLADGFHRFHAYQKAGKSKVAADVRQGTRRDAILHSVGANETHGLRRTRDDKRRAVLTLLNDPEWSKWTDREIGRACQVHHETVGKLRPVTGETASERTYTTKHGTTATMKTAGINASRTQFQAKASEDNGAPIDPAMDEGEGMTGEASRLASGRTDAGEAASVDLPTIPRNIVAKVRELWSLATPSEREEIRAFTNSPAPEPKTAGHAPRDMGGDGANAGGDDVHRGAGARPSGQEIGAQPLGIGSGINVDFVERITSGPDAKRAPNSPSASTHAEAVTEPQASQAVTAPIPDDDVPAFLRKEHKPLRPHCLRPELCGSGTRDHCYSCKKAMAESEAA